MRFRINGNIENAKYCVIYRYTYNYYGFVPEFLWRNGKVGDLSEYNEEYNTIIYWWDLNEDWSKVINKKNETLSDKIYKMMLMNFRDDNWYITCFNNCPSTLKEKELLDFIRTLHKNGNFYTSDDLRGGYKLKTYLNNLISIYSSTDKSELKNNNTFKSINYSGIYFDGDKKYIGSKYVVIKVEKGFILNDFSGVSNNLSDKRIYFEMGKIKIDENIKKAFSLERLNNLILIYFDKIPELSGNKDLEFLLMERIIKNYSSKTLEIKNFNDFEYLINGIFHEKLIYKEIIEVKPEYRIVESEDYYIGYNRIIEKGINGEITKVYKFDCDNDEYKLIEDNITKESEDRVKLKGLNLKFFQAPEIEINLSTILNLHDKNYYDLNSIIENILHTDLANIKLYQTKNYYNKEKTIEALSFFKLDITILNKEQTINLFYYLINEIKDIAQDLFLYCDNNGVYIEFNQYADKNEYYNRIKPANVTKTSLNNYYRDFIQPWKNSDEYKEIQETIEYKKDYKDYYSIDAPEPPKNKSKNVYFYNYLEEQTGLNVIKIGRTNNQSNRVSLYKRTGLEGQGKNTAYLMDYSYTPLTGDEEIDKWILYCHEDLLKYFCKLRCCETLDDFKTYLSNNGKTKEVNEHIIELLSKNLDLNQLNKMEHRKDESNGKPKLGEEYYEILTDVEALKSIINDFKTLMEDITPKDLLKLRSISELKSYINSKTFNGEMKLKEEEFIAKVEEILSNE